MPPMDRRPPLAVSPRRLRPRRNLRAVTPSDLSPPVSNKIRTPIRSSLPCDKLMSLEYDPPVPSISSQLIKMANKVRDEFKENADFSSPRKIPSLVAAPLFERGRLYDAYSARRDERLKRKQGGMMIDEAVIADDPEVAVELAKRRYAKKAESVRKSVPANFSASRGSGIRSSLRSSKEMKKGSVAGSFQKAAVVDAGKRIGVRRALIG